MLTNDRVSVKASRPSGEEDQFFEVPGGNNGFLPSDTERVLLDEPAPPEGILHFEATGPDTDPEDASNLVTSEPEAPVIAEQAEEATLFDGSELSKGTQVLEFEQHPAEITGDFNGEQQYIWSSPVKPLKLTGTRGAWKSLVAVLLASLPVLTVAIFLRLFNFGHQSAYMDEGNYIVTGRLWLEQGTIYANAMQWTFGSLLYPVLAGWFDMQGGLNTARLLSLFFGLVTVQGTIFLTLGLLKAHPENLQQERGDFALSSKPMVASLLAGLIVAVLPTASALSRFATYDSMAVGLFVAGCAAYVWAMREGKIARSSGDKRTRVTASLFAGAAVLLFLAFLTKYLVAIYLPFLCLILLATPGMRRQALAWFIMPLSLACAAYYLLFTEQLNALLRFASQYKGLKSDNIWQIYFVERLDIIVLMLLGYWGLRQAFRNQRFKAPLLLWGGALVMLGFQLISRPDFDYWKHSIYMIVFLAPLAGWLWSDWSWWDEPVANHSPGLLERNWNRYKESRWASNRRLSFDLVERNIGGTSATERPGSYSLSLTVAFILVVLGFVWSQTDVPKLLGHWPSLSTTTIGVIRQTEAQGGPVLVDDSAMTYNLYGQVAADQVINPFYYTYKGLNGLPAYTQALKDQQFTLLILDGGATATGQDFWRNLQPVIKSVPAYQLVYSEQLATPFMEEPHTLEIYRLFSKEELAEGVKSPVIVTPGTPSKQGGTVVATPGTVPVNTRAAGAVAQTTTAPAVQTAPVATSTPRPTIALTLTPAATVGPVYPPKATFNFESGDEGWGILPAAGGLQPGAAVSSNSTYKLDNHNSLRFSPQPANKLYTVGVNKTGDFHKISLYVFIPADKADSNVRLGLYYFDKNWTWVDNGFNDEIVPGKWNLVSWELNKTTSMQQFGLKLVGFSGSIYINGVTVE
jgi:hypothetical protein